MQAVRLICEFYKVNRVEGLTTYSSSTNNNVINQYNHTPIAPTQKIDEEAYELIIPDTETAQAETDEGQNTYEQHIYQTHVIEAEDTETSTTKKNKTSRRSKREYFRKNTRGL